VKFINTYGMSEAGSRISIAMPFCERFPGDSVGRPMPGVCVRIADENGSDAAAGCCGEILVKSSGVMKGYYKEPELTAATIAEGWLKTGDIGRLDEQGNLFILGRKKDVIVTGGDNVCPAEIEDCLVGHPAIREAAVVGQKHRLLEEVPYAFAVRREGFDEPTAVELLRFCRTRLSSHKIPRMVRFIERLPKLGNSKIDRNRLRDMANSDIRRMIV
jgi:long-chain acyl-CoA synthetase